MILFRGGGCGVGFCPKLVEFPEIYFKISNKNIQFDFCFSFLHFFFTSKSPYLNSPCIPCILTHQDHKGGW
jgi:hypothetical protein